jgi:beta-galactosidase
MKHMVAGLLLLLGCAAAVDQPAVAQTVDAAVAGRRVTDLSADWRFAFAPADADPARAGLDDGGWQRVAVPHSWNRVGSYTPERAADADMRQGAGWYRRTLTVPVEERGRRLFLEFDGVSSVADVWIDGRHVGGHAGAFSRFRVDVTDVVRPGVASIVAVRADNSAPAPGSPTEHVIPLDGDFFVAGGIYRGVRLVSVDPAHIDLTDHGGPGLYARTVGVVDGTATIAVRTLLRNHGDRRRDLSLVMRLADAAGATVATATRRVRLSRGGQDTAEAELTVRAARLWQGQADPYLYRVTAELLDGGRVIDRVEQPLGIRTFAFSPDGGFVLNGTPVPLHGASRHQDVAGRGWALTDEDHRRDLAIMAEMGVNTVRHAHYQHAQEWADAADRAGMAVWAELPFVHRSALPGGGAPDPALAANARAQLIELIRQNYNHPSIVLWSVGNEVDIGAAIDAARTGRRGPPAQSRALLAELDALSRQEDPSRPTVYADCCDGVPSELALPDAETLTDVTQVIGLNRYFGWYYGQPADLGPALDRLHGRYPDRAITVSEYGAGGALSQHSENPLGGPVSSYGRPQPEEYQSWVLQENWQAIAARPWVAASWVWNMFDFATTSRSEGDATDINTKGLVSHDRQTRKDAFYFFQAQWGDRPVLHLNSRRYTDRPYPVVDVQAYSTAAEATLTVEGRQVGTAACPGHVCRWPGVALRPGANRVVASATIEGQPVTDEVIWNGPDPAAAGLFINAGAIATAPVGGVLYGSDQFFTGGEGRRLSGRNPMAPPPPVAGAADPTLFATYRQGSFGYVIPLPPSDWRVTIATFEPVEQGAGRRFDVLANGATAIADLSPGEAAGGSRRAVLRSFDTTSPDGVLRLDFRPTQGEAVVAGIAIEPRTPARR